MIFYVQLHDTGWGNKSNVPYPPHRSDVGAYIKFINICKEFSASLLNYWFNLKALRIIPGLQFALCFVENNNAKTILYVQSAVISFIYPRHGRGCFSKYDILPVHA